MSKAYRFEELNVYKVAKEISHGVYDLSAKGEFFRDYALKNQIRDASVSIFSNICEGYERDGDKELRQFLYYAKGSAGEVRSQLIFAYERGYFDQVSYKKYYDMLIYESRMLKSMINSINETGHGGKKFKPME
ncbi:MAG: four helix bundle protein [Spirochaetia bacterium]|nr:four helix bundle protein [Spirochaetia bacterium]